MTNDNNLLLIIIIAVVLLWIFKLNSSETFKNSSSIRKYSKNSIENFGKVPSELLKAKNVADSDLIDKLYAEKLSKGDTNSVKSTYSSGVPPNDKQELFQKPPNPNQSLEQRAPLYKQMASPTKGQPVYELDNPTNQTYQSFDDQSYMLLPSNAPKDPKFNKVMPPESRKTLTTGDLLPKDENKEWFQVPNSKFNLMQAVDLEVPEIKIGTDTVGQSRKNATYDLRTAPPNPKFVVSPWMNSTIEPDYNTKPLC